MARLSVQHCVLGLSARQHGRPVTTDLLGINYFYTVPADTEFPKTVAQVEVFVRFFGEDLPPVSVQVVVGRVLGRRAIGGLLYRRRFVVSDVPQPGSVVIDRTFKLLYLRLPGEGEYAVQVHRRVRPEWGNEPSYRVLTTERFWVRRAT